MSEKELGKNKQVSYIIETIPNLVLTLSNHSVENLLLYLFTENGFVIRHLNQEFFTYKMKVILLLNHYFFIYIRF